jgi:PAS domain S-box-containing protein
MIRRRHASREDLIGAVAELQIRLSEANETLRAIRSGEVDAVVVPGKRGPQVFTLDGAEHAYRVLIESMNEGALTLNAKKTIFYANKCFARMVGAPLEKVIGVPLRRFLSAEDHEALGPLLKRREKSGSKVQALLIPGAGPGIPVQLSIRPLAENGNKGATIGMVVTDLTEAHRAKEMLRTLTHRIVTMQEEERGRVAFELHDNITQLICAVLFRSQALADSLSPRDGISKREALKLREMLGKTALEVERISHNLGPHVLDHLGLPTALREVGAEFEDRTGVAVKLACVNLAVRLPADTELALYRILQEALRNVEKHASARKVTVCLSQDHGFVRLEIKDDGIGFNSENHPSGRRGKGGLGLLSMRERASYVGGALTIDSRLRAGTRIEVLVPRGPQARKPGSSAPGL